MNTLLTKRFQRRFLSISNYIAEHFYADYADQWEEGVLQTLEAIGKHPRLGREAFPELNRPEIRKFLCGDYWIYYRLKPNRCEFLSVKHSLQNVRGLRSL